MRRAGSVLNVTHAVPYGAEPGSPFDEAAKESAAQPREGVEVLVLYFSTLL